MAGTNIGPLTLKIMANADAMTSVMNQVSANTAKWAKNHAAVMKGANAFAGPKNLFAGAAKFAGDAYANPIRAANDVLLGGVANFAGMVPVVGAALALPLRAVQSGISVALDAFDAASSNILAIGKGAAKTGMSAADFQVFAIMAEGAEKAERSMGKFQQALATAQFTAVGVRTKFDDLGMDGKKLAELYERDAPAALGVFGDKLRALGHPALQAHAALEMFGKRGVEMMPMLLKGSAGIAEMRGKIEKFGVGVDGGLVASVREVAKASREVKFLWEGFSNQLVTAVAPVMAEIAARLGSLPLGFKGMGDKILSTVDRVGGATASWLDSIASAWDGGGISSAMKTAWNDFVGLALKGVDLLADTMSAAFHEKLKPPKWLSLAVDFTTFGKISDGAAKKSTAGRDAAARLAAEADVVKNMMPSGNGSGVSGVGKLRKGFDDFMRDVYARKAGMGGEGGPLDVLGPIRKRMLDLKEGIKGPLDHLRDSFFEIKAITDKIASEQIKMDAIARNKKDMDAMGLAGPHMPSGDLTGQFTKRQAGLAMFKAFAALPKLEEKKWTGAMEKGGAEAYTAILEYQSKPDDVMLQMKMIQEQILAEQKEQNRIGQALLDAAAKDPNFVNF